MRLCVFSDIHGNYPAFHVAYETILAERADRNIFLGDLCGYYFSQLEIFELLLRIPSLVSLRGNHDQVYLDILGGDKHLRKRYLQQYGPSMEMLLESDSRGALADWLATLPAEYIDDDIKIACYHGSPVDPLTGYVYPDTAFSDARLIGRAAFFLGHTHYRMIRSLGGTLVTNPGSLGQPRDGYPPSFMVVDLAKKRVAYKNIVYDRDILRRDLARKGVAGGYLLEILDRQQ